MSLSSISILLVDGDGGLLSYSLKGVVSKTHFFDEYFVCPASFEYVGGLAAGGTVLDTGDD